MRERRDPPGPRPPELAGEQLLSAIFETPLLQRRCAITWESGEIFFPPDIRLPPTSRRIAGHIRGVELFGLAPGVSIRWERAAITRVEEPFGGPAVDEIELRPPVAHAVIGGAAVAKAPITVKADGYDAAGYVLSFDAHVVVVRVSPKST